MAYVSKVNFVGTRNCFVTLPQELKTNSTGIQVVKVESPTGVVYSCCTNNSLKQNVCIEINGIFGAKQGLQHDQEVVITMLQSVPQCSTVFIEPASIDDWEVIELNASHLEDNILRQVRVVAEEQVFPIWVKNSLCLFVKVVRIEPPSIYALLVENTEVHINPLFRSKSNQVVTNGNENFLENISNERESSVDPSCATNSKDGFFKKFMCSLTSFVPQMYKRKIDNFQNDLRKETVHFIDIIPCRVLAIERFLKTNSKVFKFWSTEEFRHVPTCEVYMSEKYLMKKLKSIDFTRNHSFLAIMKKLQIDEFKEKDGKHKKTNKSSTPENPLIVKSVVVRVNLLNDENLGENLESCFEDSILVSENLRTMLDIDITCRVTLETPEDFEPFLSRPEKMIVTPMFQPDDGSTAEMMEIAVRNYFESLLKVSTGPLILNNNEMFECFLKIARGMFVIKFSQEIKEPNLHKLENKFCFLSNEGLSAVSIKVDINDSFKNVLLGEFYKKNSTIDKDGGDDNKHITTMDANPGTDTIEQVKKYIKFCCECYENGEHHVFRHGGMLLTGSKGSGKTTLCHQLQKKLQTQAKSFYVKFVDCNELYGKNINYLSQTFSNIFDELFIRRPSLLILDNLDSIASNCTKEEMENSSRAMLHTQTAHMIVQTVLKESYNNGFNLLFVTTESVDKLHPIFKEKLLFTQMYKVKEFDKMNFLKKCISDILETFDGDDNLRDCTTSAIYSSKLDGYVAQDIKIIASQVVIQAFSGSQQSNDLKITDDDVKAALDKYTPLQLRHSKLSTPPSIGWTDVGALKDAKNILVETLLWPTKYPHIFKNYPLPLRKGALLYGAPGTGKTLLASAAANECKLNLICVKGPELLNKFIGASEKAVRETFARARNARPSIIFFDELDSLAPRRGHDNTGVTDRVVNQLLAELDGVEQLEGVFILAATSRPDLIDPALLRPGRLDRFLFCPVPNEAERREILTTLAKNVTLSEDVDLETLARLTRDFTGADIKALIYNSLLEAAHDDEKDSLGQSPLVITQRHLLAAIKSTRPSLNPNDRKFYDHIFSSFDGGSVKQIMVEGIGQKTTLA